MARDEMKVNAENVSYAIVQFVNQSRVLTHGSIVNFHVKMKLF